MSIAPILKEIGRGKEGARAMSFEQARDVFAQVLRGQVSGIELGAFCAAMRIKGETPQEMAGFLKASAEVQQETGLRIPAGAQMPIVLPSYNGSRRLPTLTPLLALMLQQRGVPVLVHGMPTEDARVHAFDVFAGLGFMAMSPCDTELSPSLEPSALHTRAVARREAAVPQAGELRLVHTASLHPGLAALLEVRRVMGLRNSAHSLVKLMNPFEGRALIVGSYTHPEYAVSMRAVFEAVQADAVLLRGTEGEPVADPRRAVALDAFLKGRHRRLQEAQAGTLAALPDLPAADAASTAQWTTDVLQGQRAAPAPVLLQVEQLVRWREVLMLSQPSCESHSEQRACA